MIRVSLGRAGQGNPWERARNFFQGPAPVSLEEKGRAPPPPGAL